jgi:hypothetical protein
MKTGALPLALCVALLSSCAPDAQDRSVTLALRNAGREPLNCRLMFGHWVDRDLGTLAPGAGTEIAMTQASQDGALYILRADGERRMMIETIRCAQSGDWMRNFGQVDLAPIRSRRAPAIEASCAAPAGEGRTTCRLDRIE